MKRVLIIMLCCVFIYLISAAASTQNPGSVTITMTTQVEAGYKVDVPPNISIPCGNATTGFNLNISELKLDAGSYLIVSLDDSQRRLTTADGTGAINYNVLYNGTTFTSTNVSEAQNLAFTLSIDENEWRNAPTGTYTDTMTFRFAARAE